MARAQLRVSEDCVIAAGGGWCRVVAVAVVPLLVASVLDGVKAKAEGLCPKNRRIR